MHSLTMQQRQFMENYDTEVNKLMGFKKKKKSKNIFQENWIFDPQNRERWWSANKNKLISYESGITLGKKNKQIENNAKNWMRSR